jgi:hypothetical protein
VGFNGGWLLSWLNISLRLSALVEESSVLVLDF